MMYKKLYHTNEYNLLLTEIARLKNELKVIRKVAREDHNLELGKITGEHFRYIMFDMLNCDGDSDSSVNPWYDNSFVNLSGWMRRIRGSHERDLNNHYRGTNVANMSYYVSSCPQLADCLNPKTVDADSLFNELGSVDVDRKTAMCYYDKESVTNYEIVTRYLFTTLLLKRYRHISERTHQLCYEIASQEYMANRSIQSIRAKTEDLAHASLPGGGARYSDDFHPLIEGGKRGWGYAGKVVVLPDGFTPKPAGMMYHNSDWRGYNDTIPFVTSKRQLESLNRIFKDTLVTNVANSKRGLVTYVHGQVESKEAADEDVELYEVTTDYYRNSNSMKRFVSDSCFINADFDEHRNSATNTVDARLKGIQGIGRNSRSMPVIYSIENCASTRLTWCCNATSSLSNSLSVVQEGASVVPGINIKVQVASNNYNDNVDDYKGIQTYRIGYHDSLEVHSERVSSGEWDIDTDKPCVMQLGHTLFKKRLPPRNNPTFSQDKSVAIQEKRYVAKWLSDTGYAELVSGTSPKRALANIRRRIRSSIVDTLDIF